MPVNSSLNRGLRSILACLLLAICTDADALTCTVGADDVAFGAIDPLSGSATEVSANIQVDCNEPLLALTDDTVSVCISLDEGSGGSDGSSFRFMSSGPDTLPYNLYKDAARTQIWGSQTAFPASGPQAIEIPLTGTLGLLATGTATVPVYGRIPAAISTLPVGNYLSTFTAGASIRYDSADDLPCDGTTGTSAADTFVVIASIAASCTVEVDDLDFGMRSHLDTAVDATSQVRTNCTSGVPFSIGMSPGSSGDLLQRRMVHGSVAGEYVTYELFGDASHTQLWGDGTAGTNLVFATGTGTVQGTTIYGEVPVQDTARPGEYSDTIIVIVSY